VTTETMPMVRESALSTTRLDTLQWKAAIESMNEVTKFVAEGLKEGIDNDYAVIPGTGTKKTLLKPGAQKICMAFNVYPRPQVTRRNLDNDHVEYEVIVELVSRNSGEVVSTGVGICSTKEAKYRYKGDAMESTGEMVPKAYWDAKKAGDAERMAALLGGKGFRAKKIDDAWMICKSSGEKQENPDIADTYNTVLKMAEKRGLMDATLNLSCISQHFTQDLDERLPEEPAKPAMTQCNQMNQFTTLLDRAIKRGITKAEFNKQWANKTPPDQIPPDEFQNAYTATVAWCQTRIAELDAKKAGEAAQQAAAEPEPAPLEVEGELVEVGI
jgi:hypothetical protein